MENHPGARKWSHGDHKFPKVPVVGPLPNMGVALTTYKSWDDPPSWKFKHPNFDAGSDIKLLTTWMLKWPTKLTRSKSCSLFCCSEVGEENKQILLTTNHKKSQIIQVTWEAIQTDPTTNNQILYIVPLRCIFWASFVLAKCLNHETSFSIKTFRKPYVLSFEVTDPKDCFLIFHSRLDLLCHPGCIFWRRKVFIGIPEPKN